jgi:hypothetical protein
MGAIDLRPQKVVAAAEYVRKLTDAGVPAATIIGGLVANHGATYHVRYHASRLSCAGVGSVCTFTPDKGLLENWSKAAMLRLMASATVSAAALLAELGVRLPLRLCDEEIGLVLDADGNKVFVVDDSREGHEATTETARLFVEAINARGAA